ncbi:MAG: outer membrane beta-barrel protein [Vicinamibacterales bacterium]
MRYRLGATVFLLVLISSVPASADATLFIGATTTPTSRPARGFAIGASLVIVGFEFEYAYTSEDLDDVAPSLTTGMGNAYLQTPIGKIQFYGLLGAGFYREGLSGEHATSAATAVGGGAKISLAGPLRIRLDYRLFNLRGQPRHDQVHRVYAGLNLMF